MLVNSNRDQIGMYLAIASLVLAPFCSYLLRRHSRALDFAQILYAFYLAFAPTAIIFSSNLDYSFLSFMKNFLNFCTSGDYVCTYGNLLSPGAAWLGSVVLLFIMIKILACCNKKFSYAKLYTFWKGFLCWFMAPLVYYSTGYLIKFLQNNKISSDNNFIACVVVLAFFVVWSLVQLIGYKLVEINEQAKWKKNIEFMYRWNICIIMVLVQIYLNINTLAKYFIYGPLVINVLICFFKYKFTYNIFQKLFFLITQAIIITIYSFYIFDFTYINKNDLDLIGLAIIVVMEILIVIPKFVNNCKSNGEQESGSQVHPEDRSVSKMRKENSFQAMDVIPKNSYQNINSPTPQKNSTNRRR